MNPITNWLIPPWIKASARAHMPRELRTWAFLAITLGVVEGGVLAVIVHNFWLGKVSDDLLAQAVAVMAGAPSFANAASLIWARVAHGRHKIRSVSILLMATSIAVGMMTFVPISDAGLLIFLFLGVSARMLWSGVITLRASIWRANFPREVRATLAGKIAALSALLVAATGAFVGWTLDHYPAEFHLFFPIAGLMGLIGALTYSRMRMRGHQAILNSEIEATSGGPNRQIDGTGVFTILRQDPMFRDYLGVMFVFGSGNLMALAPLILVLNDIGVGRLQQMLLTSSLPLALLPFWVGFWARRLDNCHVIKFRLRHSWSFVAALTLFALGAILSWMPLFWLAAFTLGSAYAGGMLGWNLGHHDFAPADKASQYMGLHVSLTGLRGLIMPLVGVNLYQWFSSNTHINPGWAMLLPCSLSFVGALGFVWLHRKYRTQLAMVNESRTDTRMIQSRSTAGS